GKLPFHGSNENKISRRWQYSGLRTWLFQLLTRAQACAFLIRLAAHIEFRMRSSPASHLRNIPENHPFLWDFNAFWNSSFIKLGGYVLLAVRWKGINNAPNSRWHIVRVHGCNHEVTCFRCRNRGLHRVRVPHLTHKNDVRVLSQRVLKRGRETVRIGTNFALV